jgi:hypothetical protein
MAFKPIEANFSKKINFSYTNGLATPKYNRSYHQKINYQSPQVSVVLQKGYDHHQSCETIKESKMPVLVSRFSQETDLNIQETKTQDHLLELMANTERKRSESIVQQQKSKFEKKTS